MASVSPGVQEIAAVVKGLSAGDFKGAALELAFRRANPALAQVDRTQKRQQERGCPLRARGKLAGPKSLAAA